MAFNTKIFWIHLHMAGEMVGLRIETGAKVQEASNIAYREILDLRIKRKLVNLDPKLINLEIKLRERSLQRINDISMFTYSTSMININKINK